MANIGNYQDTANGEVQGDISPVPAGEYLLAIVKSEEKPTKSGQGSYINLELEIMDGACKGRRLWDMLNLNNPNAQAVEIANRTLNAICHATGKLRQNVQDTEELHGIPMLAKVTVKSDSQYGDKNVVKAYKPANMASGAHGAGQAATAGQSRPWGGQNTAA